MIKFSILITTKNRCKELQITLNSLRNLMDRDDVEVIVCDDGSADDTSLILSKKFPSIRIIRNIKSKGLVYSRNKLLAITEALFSISLDDDANFLSESPLEIIEEYFEKNPNCGVIAFRIFWGKTLPQNLTSNEKSLRVKGFVGCGHVWNMKAWKNIPNYPEWFVFYGEEQFAAFQLFKDNWQVHYHPELFIHHRVHIKGRKRDEDYRIRLRRSLRSGWYLYLLFYPLKQIPRRFLYTLWIQLKSKVFKGDVKALMAITQALGDVIYNIPRIYKNANRFGTEEFKKFDILPETKIYWNP